MKRSGTTVTCRMTGSIHGCGLQLRTNWESGSRRTGCRFPIMWNSSHPCMMTGTGSLTGHVVRGFVTVNKNERYELLRERIRVLLRRDLPHRVPKEICERLAPRAAEIKKAYQEQMLRQFGKVEESAFPPCMQALITALAAGTNLTHAGRFSLTAFLHNIGMDTTGIAELYARSPDFDIEKTMYQVEHITGRGGSGPSTRPRPARRCRQPASVSTAIPSAKRSVTRSVTTR